MHADSTSDMFSYLDVIFMSVAWGVFMNVRGFIIDAITVTRIVLRGASLLSIPELPSFSVLTAFVVMAWFGVRSGSTDSCPRQT